MSFEDCNTEAVSAAARAHAVAAWPNEAVGFVVAGVYEPQANIAIESAETFAVTDAAYLDAVSRGLQGIVHSHPVLDGQYPVAWPSASDMRAQIATDLPWGIVVAGKESAVPPFWWGDAVPMPKLKGRPFRHGVTDCMSLIRDWYRQERGVTLPVGPRDWDWWAKPEGAEGRNLYLENFGPAGFTVVDKATAQRGDVFLAKAGLKTTVPNHGAVYLGRGLILHHKAGRLGFDPSRLSIEEPVARWMPFITHCLRHESSGS
ncbi:tail protein [Hypericibacter terrae]|uniref:Tail protein n=1 Tax=Hypericibacter terrae TaxID=2602015 RepID=A0A5J6MLK5_9PROT|nr:NlpC/P60 family protein [Hypericibacter terrae]QEX18482.1 tail protein [Hypericibacter terrae]